jgi:hypothetical protein
MFPQDNHKEMASVMTFVRNGDDFKHIPFYEFSRCCNVLPCWIFVHPDRLKSISFKAKEADLSASLFYLLCLNPDNQQVSIE